MPDLDDQDDAILDLDLADAGLALDPSGIWIDEAQNVGVLRQGGHVVVGWVEFEWRGAVPPPDYVLRDAVHLPPPVGSEHLTDVITRARAAGIARRQTCRYCRETFNPGWMHDADVCQGCAERHLGVVH